MKPHAYAETTDVSTEKSQAELDKILKQHGAAQRGFMSDDEKGLAVVTFRLAGRHVRIGIPLPKLGDMAASRLPRCSPVESQAKRLEQACRQRWRAVVLVVKAKLELVRLGVSSYEREFLADIYLPDGRTVGEVLKAQLVAAYANGVTPPLLEMRVTTLPECEDAELEETLQ